MLKLSKCKEDYSWNPSTCICENSKYLVSIADNSVTECDEIMIFMDIVSTKMTNTKAKKKKKTKYYVYCYNKLS